MSGTGWPIPHPGRLRCGHGPPHLPHRYSKNCTKNALSIYVCDIFLVTLWDPTDHPAQDLWIRWDARGTLKLEKWEVREREWENKREKNYSWDKDSSSKPSHDNPNPKFWSNFPLQQKDFQNDFLGLCTKKKKSRTMISKANFEVVSSIARAAIYKEISDLQKVRKISNENKNISE